MQIFRLAFHNEVKNVCETIDLHNGSYIIRASQKITILSITTPKASTVLIRHRFSLIARSLFWALFVIDISSLYAQPSRTSGRTGGRTGGAQFSQVTRLLNATLPTVNVFDAQGNPLSTASLRGSYTVLVFGCLT